MTAKNNSAKWQLLLMIGMVVGVILAGYLVFPKTDEARAALLEKIGTTNHGELIAEPVTINNLALRTSDGGSWQLAEQKVKWRLLLIATEECSEDCSELLYMSRQVHLRLGKYTNRFERLYLTPATQQSEQLSKEHPYLKFTQTDKVELESWLASLQLGDYEGDGLALLVDQNGLAMMRYGIEHEGGGMLEDINHLMKYSSER